MVSVVVAEACSSGECHPEAVSNLEMGYLYEELVRRFSCRVVGDRPLRRERVAEPVLLVLP